MSHFAVNSSGDVYAVIGNNVREGSIWLKKELPILKQNVNVTKITIIDPETQVVTIIFTR